MRYFLKIGYDGTNYHGWQIQDNAHTVQAEIQNSLSTFFGENISVTGCGRTDTGVHAREFYLHFNTDRKMDDLQHAAYKLDRIVPKDIVIHSLIEVQEDAHSRFDAISRTYKYYITHRKDPFNERFEAFFPRKTNIDLMNKAALELFMHKDFSSFSKLHSDTRTNDCLIKEAKWEELNGKLIFTIQADRFLRNMVRAIVGTLLEVGYHKMSTQDFRDVIIARNRSRAGHSVPANGLFLEQVYYNYL